jgi:error-prone DNA polymerase
VGREDHDGDEGARPVSGPLPGMPSGSPARAAPRARLSAGETFVHLHVASGYSMQYGASTPAALVQRAVAWGQPALALTDRDGLYGAIRFVQACTEAGIDPILGVDLAIRMPTGRPDSRRPRAGPRPTNPTSGRASAWWPSLPPAAARSTGRSRRASGPPDATAPIDASPRTPVRGGAIVDPRLPRVTVLARGHRSGLDPGAGWGRLCRLVTATHLGGERGEPMAIPELIAEMATPAGMLTGGSSHTGRSARTTSDPASVGPSPLVVLLGPDSDVGRAVLHRRRGEAEAALARWRALLPRDALAIEVVCHGGPEGTPANLGHAARLYALARDHGLRVVLTAAVRHADPQEAAVVDVLDAARRLVALDVRHLDRITTAGHLSPTPAMYAIAGDVLAASGPGLQGGTAVAREGARDLLRSTVALAMECVLDPSLDLGIGAVHLPEQTVLEIEPHIDPHTVLTQRCRAKVGDAYPDATAGEREAIERRLQDELDVIAGLGFPTYFLTVATVVDLIKDLGVRVAARGSGAGSLVNYLLGISGVDPLRYGLLMERFCSPLRAQLPDIDIDVESARRTEIYEKVLARFGGERVTCVSMMDSYRVRHAIRDVGAALGMPPSEVDAMAKAFPHISARNVRSAIADLPELRASGLNAPRLDLMLDLVERLDGLPRHIALHPCGVVLSNSRLLDRTPVEASWIGFPMSQFDKDDVEELGLLKLDILGIRMQSAMAHAVDEVRRVDDVSIDLDDRKQVPLDDETTFRMIRTTHTLGCFQIESPGQRELIGKFGPESFEDIITDISLFRPGPVKSDMIVPFLNARQGWNAPEFLHPTLIPALEETEGVVVFHEQVLLMVAETTGVSLAEADEVRRAMGSPRGQAEVEKWWRPAALARGYPKDVTDKIWEVLKAFASFGFCKAHAAAFALPTYQSAWLKAHHPAAFLAGVLTHDPGMYPKRLILDDARSLGIAVLGLDVNASKPAYVIERLDISAELPLPRDPHLPDGSAYGIRLSLTDVKGISEAEVARIVAAQPFHSLADFWNRAHVSRPVTERLVLAGGFDAIYGIDVVGVAVDPGRAHRPRHRGVRAAHAPDHGGARGYAVGRHDGVHGETGSMPEIGLDGDDEGMRDVEPTDEAGIRDVEPTDYAVDETDFSAEGAREADRGGDGVDACGGSLTTLTSAGLGRRGRVTRRDLLLHVAELDRWSRSSSTTPSGTRVRTGTGLTAKRETAPESEPATADIAGLTGISGPAWESGTKAPNRPVARGRPGARSPWTGQLVDDGAESSVIGVDRPPYDGVDPPRSGFVVAGSDVAARAAAQSQAAKPVVPASAQPIQLTLDLGDTPRLEKGTGLPEMTGPERVRAELDILGLDASAHIVDFYGPMLDALGVTRSTEILDARSRSEILVAGVKVATQTPPIRSGRRVVFLTLDDATGPVDATFFEDAQGPYATTVFHSWMLLVRGITRRTGPRGISVRATGAWELSGLWEAWTRGGLEAVLAAIEAEDREMVARNDAALAAAAEADGRDMPVAAKVSTSGGGREHGGDAADLQAYTGLPRGDRDDAEYAKRFERAAAAAAAEEARHTARAGGMGGHGSLPPRGATAKPETRRVLVHASGFKQSPYADVKPAGEDSRGARALATSRTVPDAVPGAVPGSASGAVSGADRDGVADHRTGRPGGGDRPDVTSDVTSDEVRTLGMPPRKLWHASPGSSGH